MNLIIPMNLDELIATFEDKPIWVILKTMKDDGLEEKFNNFTKSIGVNINQLDDYVLQLLDILYTSPISRQNYDKNLRAFRLRQTPKPHH